MADNRRGIAPMDGAPTVRRVFEELERRPDAVPGAPVTRRRFVAIAAAAALVGAAASEALIVTEDGWVIRAADVGSGLLAELRGIRLHAG
jgi:hypothetical protein